MKTYKRRCWFCGHLGMVKQDDFYACESCGATWNDVLEPGRSPVTEETEATYSKGSGAAERVRSPSGVVKACATRARNLKERVTESKRGRRR